MTRLGMVFIRGLGAPQQEVFFHRIIAGMEDVLTRTQGSLLVARVDDTDDELATYAHWKSSQAVDAVIVNNLSVDDPRPPALHQLGLPTVSLCDTTQTGPCPAVCFDNGDAMRTAVNFLTGKGHDWIARITGPAAFVHTRVRNTVFLDLMRAAGTTWPLLVGDYSEACGEALTRQLLSSGPAPSAIVYDNDLMAVGGRLAAQSLGVAVPRDLALLAWDDSTTCQLETPGLTALSHDVSAMGSQLATLGLELVEHGRGRRVVADPPVIVERGSTSWSAGPQI